MKAAGADKAAVDVEVKALLKLKEDYAAAGGVVEAPKVLLPTAVPDF